MTDTPETTIPGERGQTSAARKVDSNPLLKRGTVVQRLYGKGVSISARPSSKVSAFVKARSWRILLLP